MSEPQKVSQLTKTYFASPVVIPCTIRQFTKEGIEEHKIFFELRRETNDEVKSDNAAALIDNSDFARRRFLRFCKLLVAMPEEFTDFPRDDRPLPDRVFEYFSGDTGLENVWMAVMAGYETAVYPAETFRGF